MTLVSSANKLYTFYLYADFPTTSHSSFFFSFLNKIWRHDPNPLFLVRVQKQALPLVFTRLAQEKSILEQKTVAKGLRAGGRCGRGRQIVLVLYVLMFTALIY